MRTFNKDTKNLAFVMVLSVIIVASTAFAGASYAKAGTPQPSAKNYEALNLIKQNQTILAKNRDAYNKFMQAKNDNILQGQALGKDGWCVDWATMKLTQCKEGFPRP